MGNVRPTGGTLEQQQSRLRAHERVSASSSTTRVSSRLSLCSGMRRRQLILGSVGLLVCFVAVACMLEGAVLLKQHLGEAAGGAPERRGGGLLGWLSRREAGPSLSPREDDILRTAVQKVLEELKHDPAAVQELLAGAAAVRAGDYSAAPSAEAVPTIGMSGDVASRGAAAAAQLPQPPPLSSRPQQQRGPPLAARHSLVNKRRHRETRVSGGQPSIPPAPASSPSAVAESASTEGSVWTSHSSGFADISPLVRVQCAIPFDTEGGVAPAGKGAGLPPLSAELLRRVAQQGVVVATFSNRRMLDMMFNWALHLRLAGLTAGPLVGLMKDVTQEQQARVLAHIAAYSAEKDTNLSKDRNAQGGRWILARDLIQVAVEAGVSLLLSDSDVVWLQNPVPYVLAVHRKEPDIDFLISSDAPISSALAFSEHNYIKVGGARELGLEDSLSNHAPFNIGIMWLTAKPSCTALLQMFADTVARVQEVDQWPINLMLREGMMERLLGDSSRSRPVVNRAIFPTVNGTFSMGVLNVYQFCSSLVYSVTQQYRGLGVTPYGVHLTYVQDQAIEAKRLRAREEMMFADPPSHYTGSKLLAFGVEIPAHMAEPRDMLRGQPPHHHYALLDLQLRHLQAALFIGHVLGRRVVLPRFLCTCQNEGYTPHENCRGPGHPTKLPYLCPTDHWGRPKQLMELNTAPPGLLEHPCMPAEFRASTVFVRVCGPGGKPCPTPFPSGAVMLSPNSTDDMVRSALQQHKDVNVLSFNDIADALGGFLDAESDSNRDFVDLANRALYQYFTYDPPPSVASGKGGGDWTDPMGEVHIKDFTWPAPWQSAAHRVSGI